MGDRDPDRPAESALGYWPRQNGKTLALYRETINGVRVEPDALVHLMCHPDDLDHVRAHLGAVLAVDPSLRPVDLHVSEVVFKGSVFAFRDHDSMPPVDPIRFH